MLQAELVIQHPVTVIGDAKAEDVVFCMKQVFEHILDEYPTTPMFKDYYTIHSFTRTNHSKCQKQSVAVASAIATVTTPPAPAPAKTVTTSGKAKASKAVSTLLVIVLSLSD